MTPRTGQELLGDVPGVTSRVSSAAVSSTASLGSTASPVLEIPHSIASPTSRRLARAGLALVILTMVMVGALHLLPQTAIYSPIQRTISEYALSPLGWVFEVAVIALALGSLAILGALIGHKVMKPWSVGTVFLTLWSVSLVMLVVFTKHDWSVGPSTEGHIHRVFSLVAFLSLPVAVIAIARPWLQTARQRTAAWTTLSLGVLSLIWFSPLALAVLLAPVTGTPWYRAVPLGLLERGLAVTEVLAVVALAVWVLRKPANEPTTHLTGLTPG